MREQTQLSHEARGVYCGGVGICAQCGLENLEIEMTRIGRDKRDGQHFFESYEHVASKYIVAHWLRAARAQRNPRSIAPDNGRFFERNAAQCIWLEYPVMDPWNLHCWGRVDPHYRERPPTFDECVRDFRRPRYVLDIAVSDGNEVTGVIEIVKTNPLDEIKLAFLRQHVDFVIALPTHWIMAQRRAPVEFPEKYIKHLAHSEAA